MYKDSAILSRGVECLYATMFSSPNARVNQDNRTGEYFTADRNGNRRPTDMQALPSRPRTINPAHQHSAASQLHSTAGLHRPITQQIRQSGVSLTGHASTVNRHNPTGNLPDLLPMIPLPRVTQRYRTRLHSLLAINGRRILHEVFA